MFTCLMTSLTNRAGPTRIWKTIKGKKVKTSDGKDIGEIKNISENHLLLEQGKVHKHRFWIPKYVADAFDGKILWLVLSEEEVRGRYQYGVEPSTQENYANEFEQFRKTPYGQKISYASDFNENIRVVENYSNIRDLQSTAQTEVTGSVNEAIDKSKKGDDQKEKEKKDTEMSKRDDNQSATKYYSKQPVNINLPRTTERSVQPVMDKPTEPESSVEPKKNDDNNSSSNSSPIGLPPSSSHTTPEIHHMDDVDTESLSVDDKVAVNLVRITSNEHEQATMHSSTPTSTTTDKPGNAPTIASPLSSIYTSHKNKETDSSPSVVEVGPTKIKEKPHDNIVPKTSIQSPPMIDSSQTSMVSNKDKETDTDIQPVLAQVTQPIVEVKPEEQQIVPVSEKNEETSLDLTTIAKLKSTSIEEIKPTSTSLIPANHESSQISLYDNSHTFTNDNRNVTSTLGGYFDPFLVGMAMWQEWLNMCSEIAAIGASLSLDWFESFWKFLTPSTKEYSDNI